LLFVVSLLAGHVLQGNGLSIEEWFCPKKKTTLFPHDVMSSTIIDKRPPSRPEPDYARLLLKKIFFLL
jgi:hypothetical protein